MPRVVTGKLLNLDSVKVYDICILSHVIIDFVQLARNRLQSMLIVA